MKMSVQSFLPPSRLTPGRHPAFLVHLDEEPTPPSWEMAKKWPTLWRWYLAVWEHPDLIGQREPEIQTAITSPSFTPKGKFQASTAYTWTQDILQKQIQPGVTIDWDDLVPYPCTCKIERVPDKDYVKVKDLEAWGDGNVHLPGLRALLMQHRDVAKRASETARARGQVLPSDTNGTTPAAPSAAPADPSLRTWGSSQASRTRPVGWGSAPPPTPDPVAATPPSREPGDEPDDIPF
jgi:hypothetical protein